jgi:hypothetical protein
VYKRQHLPDLAEKFPDAAARSRRFPDYYEAVAARTGCAYFNSQGIMEPSPVDGLHFAPEEHAKLGKALVPVIRRILS